MRTTILAIVVLAVACAAMRPTARQHDITETRTTHKRGEPYRFWTNLEDAK